MKTKPVGQSGGPPGAAPPRDRRRPLTAADTSTPPPAPSQSHASDKESSSHGKYAGISPDSVQCMSEQICVENLSEEACVALAEDLSYKLRQLIHNVALHHRHMKTPSVEVEDVNTVLKLMDTPPVLGPSNPQWVPIGENETLCTTVDPVVDLVTIATQRHTFLTVPQPSLSTSWVVDNKSLSGNTLSANLQNYFTKISKALLSGKKKLVNVALRDLSTNTHIGPIIPNIINLAILVLSNSLNDDSSTTSMTHEILYRKALNILDSLFINPCCYDTDISLQLQKLFPILISNVLGNSILSEQMLRIISSLVTVWPYFAHLGQNAILEYFCQNIEDRLTGPLVECLTALGRKTLVDGLVPHMSLIDVMTRNKSDKIYRTGLYESIMNSAFEFLRITPEKYDSKNAYIDECLYEILGDAIILRRKPYFHKEPIEEKPPSPRIDFDSSLYSPPKISKRKSQLKLLKYFPQKRENIGFYDDMFDYSNNSLGFNLIPQFIQFNIPGFRQLQVHHKREYNYESAYVNFFQNGNRYNIDRKVNVIVANGLLLRFKYKLPNKKKTIPNYSFYTL